MIICLKKNPFAPVLVVFSLLLLALPVAAQEGESISSSLLGLEQVELALGTMGQFKATGMQRFTVTDEKILAPRVSQDGRYVILQARQVGEVELEVFFRGEEESRKIIVVVTDDTRKLQGDLVLKPGEETRFAAHQIVRVSVANDRVAEVSLSDDGDALVVRGLSQGETLLHLYEQGTGEPKSFRIIVKAGN